jgi:single-strand DNA-binding protein
MTSTIIIGHLGKDCKTNVYQQLNEPSTVINFDVAVRNKYINSNNELTDSVQWYECAYWTKSDSIKDYLKKGTLVYVEGTISAKIWYNKDNQPTPQLFLRVKKVILL